MHQCNLVESVAGINFKNFPVDTTHFVCTPHGLPDRTRSHFVDLFAFHNQLGETAVGIKAAVNASSIEPDHTAYFDLDFPSSFDLKTYHAATFRRNQLWNAFNEGEH